MEFPKMEALVREHYSSPAIIVATIEAGVTLCTSGNIDDYNESDFTW